MPILSYDIAVVGIANVERAMSSIERRFIEHNRRMVGAAARVGNTPAMRAAARSSGGRAASPEREAQHVSRAAAQLDRQRSQALFRRYQEEQRLEARVQRDRTRADQKAHGERVRAAKAEERARVRATIAAQREFRARTGSGIGAAAGTIGSVGVAGLAAAGLGSGAVIASRIGPAIQQEKELTRLSVNSRAPGGKAVSVDHLRGAVNAASVATGVSTEDLTEGLSAAVAKTGHLSGALSSLHDISTAAMATGADTKDLYMLQADALEKFGLKAGETREAIALLSAQGKKGSFELRAMASQAPKTFAAAASFGFKGMEGLKDVGGLLQVARGSTGTDEGASFAVEAMMRQFKSKGAEIQSGEAFGGNKVQVFEGGDATKGARDFRSLLRETLIASGGNQMQLQKTFGEEGIRALNPFITKFRESGGGQKGADAALGILTNASDVTANWTDVQQDAALAMKSTAAQLEILNTKLTDSVSRTLLPAMLRLGPYALQAAEALGRMLDRFANDPLGNIGHLIATKVAYDIAAAAIGPKIRDVLVSALTGTGGGLGGAGGAGAGKGANVLGTAIAGLTIGVMAVETFRAGRLVIDEALPTNKGDVESGIARLNGRGGNMTAVDVQKQITEVEGQIGKIGPTSAEKFFSNPSGVPRAVLDEVLGHGGGVGGVRTALGVSDTQINEATAAKASTDAGTKDALVAELRELQKIQRELLAKTKAGEPNRGNSPSPVKS